MAGFQAFWDKFHEMSAGEKFMFKLMLNSYYPPAHGSNVFYLYDPAKHDEVSAEGRRVINEMKEWTDEHKTQIIELNDGPNPDMMNHVKLLEDLYNEIKAASRIPVPAIYLTDGRASDNEGHKVKMKPDQIDAVEKIVYRTGGLSRSIPYPNYINTLNENTDKLPVQLDLEPTQPSTDQEQA